MRLATSTGDFKWYRDSVSDAVKCFENTKFKYINLEQTGVIPALFSENEDDWKKLAKEWAEAADSAGVKYVVSHAPCLHFACLNALEDPDDEEYCKNVRAIRRSIEICNALGIKRIVVHACTSKEFTKEQFYKYNKMFYSEFFDLTEKYNITVLTENWDDNTTHFSTGKEIREFLDYIGHPLLAACWDTAHGNIDKVARDIGQYKNIIDIGDKLKGLHISDNFGDTHHHSWPFAGIINFDSVMQGLMDVGYDGYFTFEASYTLLHQKNIPYHRKDWEYDKKTVTRLVNPSTQLKQKAVDLLYEIGKHILSEYDCFEE